MDNTNTNDELQVVTTRDLVKIIGLSHQSQLNYMADPQRRHRMPPGAFKRPGGREWLWEYRSVIDWLRSGKQVDPATPLSSRRRSPGRPKGSPNKKRRIEQIEAGKAALQLHRDGA